MAVSQTMPHAYTLRRPQDDFLWACRRRTRLSQTLQKGPSVALRSESLARDVNVS